MQRYFVPIPATIETRDGNGSDFCLELVSRDVSAGGAFYPTAHPLDVGTRVNVRMLLFDGKDVRTRNARSQVTLSGTILRVDGTGMAVCFDKRYKISPIK